MWWHRALTSWQAGIMDEMLEDTLASLDDEEELEEEADAEVDKVLFEITDGKLGEGIAAQSKNAMDGLGAALKQAGLGWGDVAKCTVFLADMNNFAELNRVYSSYFSGVKPARSCIQVARLPLDAQVEIEAIALVAGGSQ